MIIGFLSFLHLLKVLLQLMQCFSVDAHFNCIIFSALKWWVLQILDSFGVNKKALSGDNLQQGSVWSFSIDKTNEIEKKFFSIFKKIILFRLTSVGSKIYSWTVFWRKSLPHPNGWPIFCFAFNRTIQKASFSWKMSPAVCFEFNTQIVCSVGLKLSTLIVSDNREK